ncbi:MAG: hypothetical protein AAF141_07655, partial [Pseudomonadota bacterium]
MDHVDQSNPNMPGASELRNVAIVEDDTNLTKYTRVKIDLEIEEVSIDPSNRTFIADCYDHCRLVAKVLTNGIREIEQRYEKYLIVRDMDIGPIRGRTIGLLKDVRGFGFDPLMGGITIAKPPLHVDDAPEFKAFVGSGAPLKLSRQLY